MDKNEAQATRTNLPTERTDPVTAIEGVTDQAHFLGRQSGDAVMALHDPITQLLGSNGGFLPLDGIRDFLSPEDQELYDEQMASVTLTDNAEYFPGTMLTGDRGFDIERAAELVEDSARFLTDSGLSIVQTLIQTEPFAKQVTLSKTATDGQVTLSDLITDVIGSVAGAHKALAAQGLFNALSAATFDEDEWEDADDAATYLMECGFNIHEDGENVGHITFPDLDSEDDWDVAELNAVDYLVEEHGFVVVNDPRTASAAVAE